MNHTTCTSLLIYLVSHFASTSAHWCCCNIFFGLFYTRTGRYLHFDCWNCLWLGFNFVFLLNIWSSDTNHHISVLVVHLYYMHMLVLQKGHFEHSCRIDPFVQEDCFTDSNKLLIPSLLIFICDSCYFSTPASRVWSLCLHCDSDLVCI